MNTSILDAKIKSSIELYINNKIHNKSILPPDYFRIGPIVMIHVLGRCVCVT